MATTIQVGRRLAELSPRAKLALMIGADALCLPLCAFLSVTLRLGSFEGALELGLFIQIALGLATLPVLGIAMAHADHSRIVRQPAGNRHGINLATSARPNPPPTRAGTGM